MSESDVKAEEILKELADMLASPQIPVQKRIANDLEVDQPFVSNARNGKLRRVTPRVLRLLEYATMRIRAAEAASSAAAEMDAEIADPTAASRATGPRRTKRGQMGGDATAAGVRSYEDDALKGVKAYLEDGYDPRLIVEQLAVLRRAQRLRRPGPTPSPTGDHSR